MGIIQNEETKSKKDREEYTEHPRLVRKISNDLIHTSLESQKLKRQNRKEKCKEIMAENIPKVMKVTKKLREHNTG